MWQPSRLMTADEWVEGVRHAWPADRVDVMVRWDGRRLESREAVLEWLAEVEPRRADDAAGSRS